MWLVWPDAWKCVLEVAVLLEDWQCGPGVRKER